LVGFINDKIIVQNLAFSILEAALFPEGWTLIFGFLTFVLHFMLDPGPNPVPEPECITVPVPLREKVAVPAPIQQHCLRSYGTIPCHPFS
jgi:hypothetical protein